MTINWDDHRVFLSIARCGTLTAAAKDLGVSQPTVSRRLETLESELKVRLFDRTQGGYVLTPVGADLFDSVQRAEEELAEANRKIYGRDQDAKGSLRVTCTEFLLNGYLGTFIWQFLLTNPSIDLSMICTQSPLSLSRGDADVAIRFTDKPPDTLIGRKLTSVAYADYASSSPAGDRFTASNRNEWDWVGIHDDTNNRLLFGTQSPVQGFKHLVDSMVAMQSMVRAGLGVTRLPCYIADQDSGLRRLQKDPLQDSRLDMWILYHREIRSAYRVRLFVDQICAQIEQDRDLFTGNRPLS